MSVLTGYPNYALFCFLPPSNSVEVDLTSLVDVEDVDAFELDQEVIVHWPTRPSRGKKCKRYAANVLLFGGLFCQFILSDVHVKCYIVC
jgi:hypothetical protein